MLLSTPERVPFWTRSTCTCTARKELVTMATLLVFKFPTAEGAGTMLSTLEGLQKQQLIQINDGAILTWPTGASKPKTKQLANMTGVGALGGAFWGMLFGLLFFVPFFGLAVGAAVGALMGHFAHYGIAEAVKDQQFDIIQTNLSKENEDKLRADFAEE